MAQLYIQKSAQPDTWVMSGAPTATTVFLSLAATINYSDGSSDTLPANTLAVLPDTTTVFDRTHDVYVCYTVQTSGVLSVIKESLLPTLTSAYAPLCRIELHSIKPYQPEPYLAAGGLGSGALPQTVTVASAAGQGKVLDLGAGGTPPTAWSDVTFDDSAWAAPVAETFATIAGPIAGTGWVTYNNSSRPASDEWLLRHHFTLPAGTATSASVQIFADDYTEAIDVNGTAVSSSEVGGAGGPVTYSITPATLVTGGGANVLAVRVKNGTSLVTNPTSVDYLLTVTVTSSPSGAGEGALLYYHGGTWQPLPAGTSGQELTVVSGDPAWTNQPAGGVTSVALAGPTGTSVSGSPVTSSGTITLSWASQSAGTFLGAPSGSSGAPTFRALVGADIPVDASTIVSSAGTIKGNYQAGSGVSITGNTIAATGSGGTVSSVALSMPGIFSVSGSPVTGSGTLAVTLANESANTIFAGPTAGTAAAPTFRALAAADLPAAAAAGGHIHAHGHFL